MVQDCFVGGAPAECGARQAAGAGAGVAHGRVVVVACHRTGQAGLRGQVPLVSARQRRGPITDFRTVVIR